MIDHSTPARCIGIIPARYASSRFPGKPLADILGKPMFWHVYQRAKACPGLHQVVLATDDQRILQAAQAEGVPAIMTRDDHSSGTDRVLEAAETLELPAGSVVVNIQGDEPALVPELLSQLLLPFENPATQVSTLARGIDQHQAQKPDMVKVVMDSSGRALYFSRACIPYPRAEGAPFLGHIGLYAFRLETLRRFAAMGPGQLEQIEKLEQLRFLEAGIPIHVQLTRHGCHGVDRPEDIARVCKIMHEHTIQ